MATGKNVPIFYTFTNWIITVIVGSIMLPAFGNLLGGHSDISAKTYFDGDTLGIILISMIVSAVCSLPALIVLFVTHLILNRNQENIRTHQFTQNVVHVVVSVFTFGVFAMYMDTRNDFEFLWSIAVTYPFVGIVVWNITYLLRRKKAVNQVSNDEVLDEL